MAVPTHPATQTKVYATYGTRHPLKRAAKLLQRLATFEELFRNLAAYKFWWPLLDKCCDALSEILCVSRLNLRFSL